MWSGRSGKNLDKNKKKNGKNNRRNQIIEEIITDSEDPVYPVTDENNYGVSSEDLKNGHDAKIPSSSSSSDEEGSSVFDPEKKDVIDLNSVMDTLETVTQSIPNSTYSGIDQIKESLEKRDTGCWSGIQEICKNQLEKFRIRALNPEIELLYRAIVEYDKNKESFPGIDTIQQLLFAQQKKDFITNYIREEKYRLSNSNIKLNAYRTLEKEIKRSSPHVSLRSILADDSEQMQAIVRNQATGKGYMLEHVPNVSVQDVLRYNRGGDVRSTTSQKKLNAFRDKLKKGFSILTGIESPLVPPTSIEEADMVEEDTFLTPKEQEKAFLQKALKDNPNQTVFAFKNKFFLRMPSQQYPGEWRIHVTYKLGDLSYIEDNLYDENTARNKKLYKHIKYTWKINKNGEWSIQRRAGELFLKSGRDVNPGFMDQEYEMTQENKFVRKNFPSERMKPLIKDPEKLTFSSIMKTHEGDTLETIVYKTKRLDSLSSEQKMKLAVAVLRAVKEQVYDKGFVHCDLKPDNIIVDLKDVNNPIVTIFDWELSLKKGQDVKAMVGTKSYLPPEMAKLDPKLKNKNKTAYFKASEKIDVFSCGKILMEILLGKLTNSDREKPQGAVLSFLLATLELTEQGEGDRLVKNYVEKATQPYRTANNPNSSQEFINLFSATLDMDANKRPNLTQCIETLENLRLEHKSEVVKKANEIANKLRDDLHQYSLSKPPHDSNYIKEQILSSFEGLPQNDETLQEYIHTLGIKALHGCQHVGDIINKVEQITGDFDYREKWIYKGKIVDELDNKIALRYRKFIHRHPFTLDGMNELNQKNVESEGCFEDDAVEMQFLNHIRKEIALESPNFQKLKEMCRERLNHSKLSKEEITFYQAILRWEHYSKNDGAQLDTLQQLLIYHQKKNIIQRCEREIYQSKSKTKTNAYKELLDFTRSSLLAINTSLYQAMIEKRQKDNHFARYFLKSEKNLSAFFNSVVFEKGIMQQIRELPDYDKIVQSMGKKNGFTH